MLQPTNASQEEQNTLCSKTLVTTSSEVQVQVQNTANREP